MAIALIAIPRRKRKFRRVGVSVSISVARSQRRRGTFRSEQCDDVGSLMGCERLSSSVVLPIGMAEVGASSDDYRTQVLVADERQVGSIDDRSCRSAFAVGAVTRLAVCRVHLRAIVRIARGGTGIGWGARGRIGNARPAFADSSDHNADLLICE